LVLSFRLHPSSFILLFSASALHTDLDSSPAAPAAAQVFTVSELTRSIRSFLEAEIGAVWVEGEVSNFRRQSSGHQYFTLKDDRCQLACVLFRGGAPLLSAGTPLADGLQVQIFGQLTVYETRGQHQLVVQIVQPKGLGALQARFEALKRRLHAEGLFDSDRKQALPRFPMTVGLVTSPTGAALRDMLNILRRRAPWMRALIHPVRVQGQGAASEIAQAIGEFNQWAQADTDKKVDLIVVARGGGSIEDLWEFNEEIVARAIADSALPVVSAVGHEIDFTIADFVADLRAPTPSAAAELIAPDAAELQRQIAAVRQFLDRQLLAYVERARERLQDFAQGALDREPRRRVQDARQRLDFAEESLSRAAMAALRQMRSQLDEKQCCLRLAGPRRSLDLRAQLLKTWREKLSAALDCQQDRLRGRLREAESLLRVLGPQATLARGYSITVNERGEIIRNVAAVQIGQRLVTRLSDGEIHSTASGSGE
jgi:exodeoxyribonuclease VII large subunit